MKRVIRNTVEDIKCYSFFDCMIHNPTVNSFHHGKAHTKYTCTCKIKVLKFITFFIFLSLIKSMVIYHSYHRYSDIWMDGLILCPFNNISVMSG